MNSIDPTKTARFSQIFGNLKQPNSLSMNSMGSMDPNPQDFRKYKASVEGGA